MTVSGPALRTPLPGFSALDEIVAGYRKLPGVPDEFIGADGRPRPQWLTFIARLVELGPEETARRFASADRHIRDTGASYRAYGDAAEKSWPIGHLPLLIDGAEWQSIAAGVTQRAELLEAVLQDVYGAGRLVEEGALPASAVTGCPDYLQSLTGVLPKGEPFIQLYAADLGRGPDGKWWVLGDRMQAPSGSGYALANRLVLSRTWPNLYRDMNVERLAPFFEAFRAGLTQRATRSDPRICLLTPGPYNETYFEQAYLARYLGLLLVEGGDLTVRDGHVHVRTIAGLKRADVILRRIDSDFADPLELNSKSRLGVAGLVEVLRGGGVALANALGAGVMETPVMMSFMPKLCRRLLGEELKLPNIATWWCGGAKERALVLSRLDELALSGAYGNSIPGGFRYQSLIGANLSGADKDELRAAIARRGIDYVGQEIVKLSTTPAWVDGQLQPRPFTLRVFVARTPGGWSVMPGGFCRVSHRLDVRAVTMGQGAESADVWVLGTAPAAQHTLLPGENTLRVRRAAGNLPSRAADNLFWFGRYLERTEAVLRLVRAYAGRLIEVGTPLDTSWTFERVAKLLHRTGALPDKHKLVGSRLAATALHSKREFGSAFRLVEDARRAASFVRERLSPDTWRLIEDVYALLDGDAAVPLEETDIIDRADAALRLLAAISGLAQENMNRGAGWHLLDMGRRVERAINACRFARRLSCVDGRPDGLAVLLELIDSQITYRSRYLVGLSRPLVRDMVCLDPYNPRSVACQVEKLVEHLKNLPKLSDDGLPEAPMRLALAIGRDLDTAVANELDDDAILGVENRLLSLANAIGTRYFLHGPTAAKAEKAMGLA